MFKKLKLHLAPLLSICLFTSLLTDLKATDFINVKNSIFYIDEITGTVINKEGESPIPFASVQVKGTKKGAVSNAKGQFILKNIKAGAVLVVSATGFKTTEVIINPDDKNITIILMTDSKESEQVIVTGYQTLRKKNFTGASTTLAAKELERAGMPDITRMLEGQFAGVAVQNVSGTFGTAPKLRIRGATSLSGDNKPLWVINGVISEDVVNISNEALSTGDMNTLLGSSIAGLNPDDVQDITILRDAAATALYGARAMNGVIVVTTKKGKQTDGQVKLSYTTNISTYLKPNYADFDILNSADQMAVMVELINKGKFQVTGSLNGASGGVMYKMYERITTYDPVTNTYALTNDTESKFKFLERYANTNTDWFDVLFRNSLSQEHSLSINSGSERSQNYASVSYYNDKGQTIGNSTERFTGNFRTNFLLGNKIKGEILSTASIRNQRAPGTRNIQSEPVYGTYFRSFDINPYNYALGTSRMLTAYDENGDLEYFRSNFAPFNIINELNQNYLKLNLMEFGLQGKVDYQFLPFLSYSVTAAYRLVKSETQTFILEGSNLVKSYRAKQDPTTVGSNEFLYKDPDSPFEYPIVVVPEGGFYNKSSSKLTSTYVRHDLKFIKDFAKIHHAEVYAGMEARNAKRQNDFFEGPGYQYENGGLVSPFHLYYKQKAEEGKAPFGLSNGTDRYLAFMVQGIYSFNDKYTITPTYRFDGSNKLGESRQARWLPTWSISGSWNINKENFWIENNILNTALLRGSYGLVANIGSANNSVATFYNILSRRPHLNDREVLTNLSSLANSDLTWEKTYDLNLGLELGILPQNKILLVVDLYKRNINDLLGSINTSGIGGEAVKYGNYATMHSKGIEVTLNAKVISNKDFGWTSRFNFAVNKSEIVRLDVNPNIWTLVSPNGGAVIGYPQRGLFSVEFTGLNHYYGYPTYVGIGDAKANTTTINLQSDKIQNLLYMGPIDATLTGGFYNQLRFKEFTISALFKYSFGNYIRLKPNISASYSDMTAMSRDVLNRWTAQGDETKTTIPNLIDEVFALHIIDENGTPISANYPYNLYNYSDQRVAKGDFIKLSNIVMSYSVPQAFCTRLRIATANISIVANNILLIHADAKLNGQDPEFVATGGVALPTQRQFTASLKIGL